MIPRERREGVAILRAILAGVLATVRDAGLAEAAVVRQAVGALSAGAADAVTAYAFAPDLAGCFTNATAAGATFAGMDGVRAAAQGLAPAYTAGRIIAATGVRLALIEMCRITAATAFASREDIVRPRSTARSSRSTARRCAT
jgi:hypothetical protein